MKPSSRTPEGQPNHCPVCGKDLQIEPSRPAGDAPCPHCGHLLWFQDAGESSSATKHKRLQKCFLVASMKMEQKDYDYATDLLQQCVLGDPSNLTYIQSLLDNLKNKYNNNKSGSKWALLKERGSRRELKKALNQEEWEGVIRNGLKVLSVNPWDILTLRSMATASERTGADKSGMLFLKAALDADPNDKDTQREIARLVEK